MKISKRFILFIALGLANLSYAAEKPKYVAPTVPLSEEFDYVKKNPAPDYWAVAPFYVSQNDARSCIPTSLTMAVNTLRAQAMKLSASDQNFTQTAFFEKYGELEPVKRFFKDKGKSVSIEEAADVLKKMINDQGLKDFKVEVIHVNDASVKTLEKIASILTQNEKSSKNIILANYIQGMVTGDPEGMVGHMAPVGAYHKAKKRVLLMDPDREYYQPYWANLEQLVKAMNTLDKDANRNRGMIWIHQ